MISIHSVISVRFPKTLSLNLLKYHPHPLYSSAPLRESLPELKYWIDLHQLREDRTDEDIDLRFERDSAGVIGHPDAAGAELLMGSESPDVWPHGLDSLDRDREADGPDLFPHDPKGVMPRHSEVDQVGIPVRKGG